MSCSNGWRQALCEHQWFLIDNKKLKKDITVFFILNIRQIGVESMCNY